MARYFAFISYSHSDAATARWLHRRLEGYRLPRAVRRQPEAGAQRARLTPVFLDRAELATSNELAADVQRALEESESLIVVCSAAAARSRWVNEEIRRFRALGRADRVFCVVAPDDATQAEGVVVFPPALAEPLGAAAAGQSPEPLAADLRSSGDGRRDGFLKLVAGLLGLRFDQLRRREQARRQRRLLALTAASLGASLVLAGLALFALVQRQEAERQRSIAEQRSLTAERTTSFLQSLFEVSDPSEALGNTITAREVLDRGARRIAESLREEPEVRATLIATLGSVYASLGLYRQADELLGRARAPGLDDAGVVAQLAIAEGELRALQGDYPAANQRFEAALRALEALGPERDPDRARALIAWGESLASLEEFPAAREKIGSGLAAARRARPQPQSLIARGVEAEALTSLLAGDLAAAEAAYRSALDARIAASGENHPKVSEDLDSLGSIEYLRGDLASAARTYERVLAINRRVFSPTHPTVAGTLNNLGRVQLERRRYAEARDLLQTARDIMLAEHSPTHDDMAFVFNNLALAEVGLGHDREAEALFALAWGAAEPHRHRMRAPILTDWADLECRTGRASDGVKRLERARALVAEDYPDDAWRLAWLELTLASCRRVARDIAPAAAAVAEDLPLVLARWPDDTDYGFSALRKAAALEDALGRPERAEALRRRMRDAERAEGGAGGAP